jgi:Kdo2-lipid IVA lauroyltransferase/acyltransferase
VTWLVKMVFRFLSVWPLWALHALGWLGGWLTYAASPTYRARLLAHTAQAGLSAEQTRRAVGESGKMLAEIPRLWLGRCVPIRWQGEATIEAALTQGRGLLLMTPHMGCFEIVAQAYAERFGEQQPITVLFRPARQRWLQDLVAHARVRPHLLTAPTNLAGVKQLIKALKAGQTVGLLPDQVPPEGQGVWAPYFGRPAYTMTLSSRLAHSGQAVPVLLWGERLSWGRGFVVHVHSVGLPSGADLSSDAHEAAAQINAAMEVLVRERPEQYLWSYARYKSPKGAVTAAAGNAG